MYDEYHFMKDSSRVTVSSQQSAVSAVRSNQQSTDYSITLHATISLTSTVEYYWYLTMYHSLLNV
jgi:hypothetical protein